MTSPYETLNVPPDAAPEMIRRAYRAAAVGKHPDQGGDREAWDALQLAYDVLRDPERRRRFDRDGTTDEPAKDTRFAKAMRMVNAALDQALDKMEKQGRSVQDTDMAAAVMRVFVDWQAEARRHLLELAVLETMHKEMAARFSSATEDNVMRAMIESRLEGLAGKRAMVKDGMAVGEFAMELLRQARYRVDQAPAYGQHALLGQFYSLGVNT